MLINIEYLSAVIVSEGGYRHINSKIDELIWSLGRLKAVSENVIDELDELMSEQEIIVAVTCYKQGLMDCFRLRIE